MATFKNQRVCKWITTGYSWTYQWEKIGCQYPSIGRVMGKIHGMKDMKGWQRDIFLAHWWIYPQSNMASKRKTIHQLMDCSNPWTEGVLSSVHGSIRDPWRGHRKYSLILSDQFRVELQGPLEDQLRSSGVQGLVALFFIFFVIVGSVIVLFGIRSWPKRINWWWESRLGPWANWFWGRWSWNSPEFLTHTA